jgi:hypothetical protein
MIKIIQAIDAREIPHKLIDSCLEINDEFPLHYSNGIVLIDDDGNPFVEWLKEVGYKFPEGQTEDWLGVWGT